MTKEILAARRYRAPTHFAEVEVSLDEFNIADIYEYLRHQKPQDIEQAAGEGLYVSPAELNQIDTLALCGQRAQAVELVMTLVSEAVGRTL